MRKDFKGIKVINFEDYDVYATYSSSLCNVTCDLDHKWLETIFYCVDEQDLLFDNLGIALPSSFIKENTEALSTAKTVYIHPKCTIPRTQVSSKYKKCLNEWLADIVVIPDVGINDYQLKNIAILEHAESKKLFIVIENSTDGIRLFKEGEIMPNVNVLFNEIRVNHSSNIDNNLHRLFKTSECIYKGKAIRFHRSGMQYCADVITNIIPNNKIIFESTLLKSLGDESNKIDVDILWNIKDMIKSKDSENIISAYKALASLDWKHYENSIRLLLNSFQNNSNPNYAKAIHSTQVKYMITQLLYGRFRSYSWYYYSKDIYQCDYDVFKKLMCRIKNTPEDNFILDYSRNLGFFKITKEGQIVPNIKE